MTLHLSHQARLSGNRTENKKNPLTMQVEGSFLCLLNDKKGRNRAYRDIVRYFAVITCKKRTK